MNNNKWDIYPRPQMKRQNFQILNTGWELNRCPIVLPYPPEAMFSEYEGEVTEKLYYTNEIAIDESLLKENGRLILHFGAVDQIADVYINNDMIYRHVGGYLPFEVDITQFVYDRTFKIKVEVEDTLDQVYPYGKQRKDHGGIWYTPVSGIWQSVWLEWVPNEYIEELIITPLSLSKIEFGVLCTFPYDFMTEKKCILKIDELEIETVIENTTYVLDLDEWVNSGGNKEKIKYWTPENPYLYKCSFSYGEDEVESYFAIRTVSIKEIKGYKRICLNDIPIFLNGVLDQGYFENGLYTPFEPEEYERDIKRMKRLGFNMLRKHIKVEPEIFYYYCDKLGMLVLQDMVNSGEYNFGYDTLLPTIGVTRVSDKGHVTNKKQIDFFIEHSKKTIEHLYNHPCIIGYTIFNEGWGQTDSDQIGDEIRVVDKSRFYDYTSGWFAQKNSDVESLHIYFRTKKLAAKDKPLILSEFGGFARKLDDHIKDWDGKQNFGYGICKDESALTDRIVKTYEKMVIPAISKGLCGAVYTQVSDIEDEINGLYTYDRQVCKVNEAKINELMHKLYKCMELNTQ